MKIEYRKGNTGDLKEICTLIKGAIVNLERHNIFQWDNLYPDEEILRQTQLLVSHYLIVFPEPRESHHREGDGEEYPRKVVFGDSCQPDGGSRGQQLKDDGDDQQDLQYHSFSVLGWLTTGRTGSRIPEPKNQQRCRER